MKNEFKEGFKANIPIGISVFTYGSVLGVLCTQKGISLIELSLMNIFIFAGASQFVIVEMYGESFDFMAVLFSALLINLRYLLISMSLVPVFIDSSLKDKFKYMHFATDESWAMTMKRLKTKETTPLYLFGGGFCLFILWFLGTFLGFNLGEFISSPEKFGLDFAFIAIFFALALSMFRGKGDFIPWVLTALIAILCEKYFEGNLYIIIAALIGSLCAAFLYKEKEENGN